MLRAATPERLSAFSDAVFAVLITVATYILLIWELLDRRPVHDVPPKVRRIMRVRSIATLCLFGASAVIALKYPLSWIRNLCLLFGCLSETGVSGSGDSNISFAFEVAHGQLAAASIAREACRGPTPADSEDDTEDSAPTGARDPRQHLLDGADGWTVSWVKSG